MGQDCKTTKDCVKGFVCDQVKQTCDAPNSKRDNTPQPQQCKSTGDCTKGQVCDQDKNVCVAPNDKRDGLSSEPQQCKSTGDCAKGQICDQDKNVCVAPNDKRSEVCSTFFTWLYLEDTDIIPRAMTSARPTPTAPRRTLARLS